MNTPPSSPEDVLPTPHPKPGDFGPYGRALLLVSEFIATLGGLAFVGLVIMSLISIVGRKLFSMPVPGDMEVLMMVAAGASAAFFAYCHLVGGDVKVDFFTSKAHPRTILLLDTIASLLVGLFGALIAWRNAVGAFSLREAEETSAILGWPVWIAQMAMTPGFILLALAGFYMAAMCWMARARVPARGC